MSRVLLVDCDHATVWITVEHGGAVRSQSGVLTGFYRGVPLGRRPDASVALEFRDAARTFDPDTTYGEERR